MAENNTLKRALFNSNFGMFTVYAQINNIYFIHPIDGYSRTAETQNKLFKVGRSKCDGYKVISKHQLDRARDLYIIDAMGKITKNADGSYPIKDYELLGKYWEGFGGVWGGRFKNKDIFHFEL